MTDTTLQNLETVAEGLGEIVDQVVFVGGATVGFYATSAGAARPRPSLDVDCIVEIQSYGDYGRLEETLRQRGFQNDRSQGAPLCRWIYRGIFVDIMPSQTDVLGFSNAWYAVEMYHTMEVALVHGQRIRILETPYFLATKLTAAINRGWKDLRTSPDFEDVVYVLRNRASIIPEIDKAEYEVQAFLKEISRQLLARDDIHEAIASVLDFGEPAGTSQLIQRQFERVSTLGVDLSY